MREIHLICNAHIDPVWLWRREEGIAEAISTFRVAADFCEEYGDFVFNHNESLLYEWVEEYEPELFERIQRLVKEGRWHIMGGWYLQPDCLMPSGETFLRQIEVGNTYFMEKFGVKPTTAINFDPFGHTRGLVQILAKSGYDSYLFMRPDGMIPEQNFLWKGYDGSEIIGHCLVGAYSTDYGTVGERVKAILEKGNGNINLMTWGIGDHGGGPSRVDYEYLVNYQKEHPEMNLTHSWCENYFSKVDKNTLKTVDTSLVHYNVGCYTTMVRIKQLHRKLENELSYCEKILAVSGIEYDKKKLREAQKALLFCEFHDILPGTCIKSAEEEAIRLLNHSSEIVAQLSNKAFFKLCQGQKKANDGEIPVLVFNPHPYWVTEDITVEFQLANQNWNDNEVTLVTVKDENGTVIPSQNEKEECNLNLDWRKRVVFRAQLKPMSINRFDCELHVEPMPKRPIRSCMETDTHYVFDNGTMQTQINKTTGLIDRYSVNGVDYLKGASAKIVAMRDDEDPWGMRVHEFQDKIGEFKALSQEETNRFNGHPQSETPAVRVIEHGDVRCKIQSTLRHENSFAIVTYTLSYTSNDIDIHVRMLSNDGNRMYKLVFDTAFCQPEFIGQTAFGKEAMRKEGKEVTFQKWCGLFETEKAFAVINNGTYGGSAHNGELAISLLRTPVYSAHPLSNRPYTESDRFNPTIDLGEREFSYKITTDASHLEQAAEIYNQAPYALSFFPSGMGKKKETSVEVDNCNIILSRFEQHSENTVLLRLFNSAQKVSGVVLSINSKQFTLSFQAFELKSFLFDGEHLTECDVFGK